MNATQNTTWSAQIAFLGYLNDSFPIIDENGTIVEILKPSATITSTSPSLGNDILCENISTNIT